VSSGSTSHFKPYFRLLVVGLAVLLVSSIGAIFLPVGGCVESQEAPGGIYCGRIDPWATLVPLGLLVSSGLVLASLALFLFVRMRVHA